MPIIEVEPLEVIESVILYYEERIFREKHPERFTKFDSDNDIFLGTIGEFAFSRYLKIRGYKYLTNFWDNKNLPDDGIKEIDGRIYDLYDFGITLSEEQTIKIDVKTQYCIGLEHYNQNWQMAVNENTINKIKNGYRNIDYFVFIFCDKESTKYIKFIENKFSNDNPIDLIKFLNSYKSKPEKLFKPISVDIVGTLEVQKFIDLSISFKEKELFRINIKKGSDTKPFYWNAKSPMSRVYIKYLMDIDKLIVPLNIDLCKEKPKDSIEFKKWFENIYKFNNLPVKIYIDEKIYINLPQDNYIKGMQYSNYIEFLDDTIKLFNENYDFMRKN
ncbi:hypothetical protein NG769_05660 [Aliarcobacter cryaerophilus]|uniref:hypothetical protein n=1 Tax=Aliarcobacter cryaerophilus TaxID=28198 RepID=UPI003DA60B5B